MKIRYFLAFAIFSTLSFALAEKGSFKRTYQSGNQAEIEGGIKKYGAKSSANGSTERGNKARAKKQLLEKKLAHMKGQQTPAGNFQDRMNAYNQASPTNKKYARQSGEQYFYQKAKVTEGAQRIKALSATIESSELIFDRPVRGSPRPLSISPTGA